MSRYGGPYGNGYANDRYANDEDDTNSYTEDRYNPERYNQSKRYGNSGRRGAEDGYNNNNNNESSDQYSQRDNSSSPERQRERRAGGYGGFGDFSVQRPTSLERRQAKRRSGGSASTSRSRSRVGGVAGRQIEEVLQTIQQDWPFMTKSECIPVRIALQLMDPSSLGLAERLDEFTNTHEEMQASLKAIVNEYHQGFNSSIGTFHKIQASILASQQRVRALRDNLVLAKGNLSTTKPELKGFAVASQTYEDMLSVLSAIEQLQLVPEKLEAKISEKRFISAVEVLQDAQKSIMRSEMENIGALSDLRVYLSNQEHSLTDILIEELHSHLYLKSPYCEDRWKAYSQNQAKPATDDSTNVPKNPRGALLDFLDELFQGPGSDLTEDANNRNPEASTFHYIHLLLVSLQRLSKLDSALTAIEQRLPVELFRVVEKCNNEVSTRHPGLAVADTPKSGNLVLDAGKTNSIVLNDLLDNLYSRFEAIAEGHRVVDDVVRVLTKGSGFEAKSGFKELWKLYQSEVRSLLHDYLATDGALAFRSGQDTIRNVFQKVQRDKSKKIFKLANLDAKTETYVKSANDLETILKTSVPGLVSSTHRNSITTNINLTSVNNALESGKGHKLLVESSVFNMGILLPPSLEFLHRLKDVVPPSSDISTGSLTNFLDDFLVNVFLPQLDETVVEAASRVMIEDDAFTIDRDWAKVASKPVFTGTAKFFAIISAVCKMLDELPHDQAFSQVVVGQIVAYYDRCCGWYKAIISRAPSKLDRNRKVKLAAALAEGGEIADVVKNIAKAQPDAPPEDFDQESKLLLVYTQPEKLEEADLMADRKTISALCLLSTSMKWLATKLARIRHITPYLADSSHGASNRRSYSRRWTVNATTGTEGDGNVYLPLNRETAAAFDGVLTSFDNLSELALYTLHLECRLHLAFYLTKCIQGPWMFPAALNEPSTEILTLNADLAAFDDAISESLAAPQQTFIKAQVSGFADTLVLALTPRIPSMNSHGRDRMALNLLVLLQNLKALSPDAALPRSSVYYEMFAEGGEKILELVRRKEMRGNFDYEELKTLIELSFSDAIQSERRDISVAAKRQCDDLVLQLSEAMWA